MKIGRLRKPLFALVAPSAAPPSSPGPRHGFNGTEPSTTIMLATSVVAVVARAPDNLITNLVVHVVDNVMR